jgi:hypothetical protein
MNNEVVADAFVSVLHELEDMFMRKNADYGDSFNQLREEEEEICELLGIAPPPWSLFTWLRLMDKMKRLRQFLAPKHEARVEESIDDTLKDLANYAIMELTARKLERRRRDQERNDIEITD